MGPRIKSVYVKLHFRTYIIRYLGISEVIRQKLFSAIFFLALIINIVGLGIATIVFVIEILVKLLKK